MLVAVTRAGAVPLTKAQTAQTMAALPPAYRFVDPLAVAAMRDEVDLFGFAHPQARWPGRQLRLATRPTVLLIGDDPGNAEGQGGPTAWQCAREIGKWCQGAIIHAAAGEPRHYQEAVRGALMLGRLAMIETTSMYVKAWAECLACPTTLLILPNDGPHPIDKRVLH